MIKKILAIIAGILTGFIIVFIGDATTHKLHPVPDGINYMDKNAMKDYITTIPTWVFVIMILFWVLSSFLGGLVSARINRAGWKSSATITGAILMGAALLNLALMPHPLWMWLAVIALYIPAALAGGYLVRGTAVAPIE
jgi:hypothetical protein